ncbi:hypothetical protein AM499_00925 [Bacillus sp. FJAT-22090]|uniref:DUF5677 domain-containing protein n=1 Tax=Bacillus sp. FJAT-22090 TaxID=1581038 RepID=UPI0006AEB321|nr:DUF5677 domain-containing protein [Bacillus sp. FJAT-22090]ALC84543.1 hypothetical protein AM499_00925 [Bacillus sp. FJAT-22090]
MNKFEELDLTMRFGENLITEYLANNELNRSTEVIIALYRKLIEFADGVYVAAEKGLHGPASLNFRGAIEIFLSLKYILMDDVNIEKRTSAYRVGYYIQQIKVGENRLAKNLDENTKEKIKILKNELASDRYQNILKEWKKRKIDINKPHTDNEPKWYSLDGGPK